MQWTGGPNAGFSDADPTQLYLPVVDDPEFGPEAVNVEAELGERDSLLQWVRRMVALRRSFPVFGLGSFEPLEHGVSPVFAHVRRLGDEIVVCAHNLSRAAQVVDLELSEFNGLEPEDLVSGERLRAVDGDPYSLALPPCGYRWLLLVGSDSTDDLPPTA
jgi:maltose alpha-D-glucosyltransferase/alpha-amylase